MGVRLFFIKKKDPVGGALGLLIDDSERELNMLDAEKVYREQQDIPLGKLLERIDSVRNSLAKHRAKAIAVGLDANRLVSRYARVGTGNICDQLGIRKAYDVSFAFMSGYVHARFSAVEDTVIRNRERAFWLLGPLTNELDLEIRAQLLDLFQDHLLVNAAAAQLL